MQGWTQNLVHNGQVSTSRMERAFLAPITQCPHLPLVMLSPLLVARLLLLLSREMLGLQIILISTLTDLGVYQLLVGFLLSVGFLVKLQ